MNPACSNCSGQSAGIGRTWKIPRGVTPVQGVPFGAGSPDRHHDPGHRAPVHHHAGGRQEEVAIGSMPCILELRLPKRKRSGPPGARCPHRSSPNRGNSAPSHHAHAVDLLLAQSAHQSGGNGPRALQLRVVREVEDAVADAECQENKTANRPPPSSLRPPLAKVFAQIIRPGLIVFQRRVAVFNLRSRYSGWRARKHGDCPARGK